MRLDQTVVPWTSLWLFYFEDWLSSDEWKGGGDTSPVPTRASGVSAIAHGSETPAEATEVSINRQPTKRHTRSCRSTAEAFAASSPPLSSRGSRSISRQPDRVVFRSDRRDVNWRHHRHRARARSVRPQDILKLYEEQGSAIFDQQHGRVENWLRQRWRGALASVRLEVSSHRCGTP